MDVWRRCICLAAIAVVLGAAAEGVSINEVRFDQLGTDHDEYVEFRGSPGESLDGLHLIVLGDNVSNSSGILEVTISLDGYSIPDDGYFLMAEPAFDVAPEEVDLSYILNFENSDNVTIMLVSALTGLAGQDLDTDDDGTLDEEPWDSVIDCIALIEEENPPTETEYHYGPPAVGPDGLNVPYYVYKIGEEPAVWLIGPQDIDEGRDTPGTRNLSPVSNSGLSATTSEDTVLPFIADEFESGFADLDGLTMTSIRISSLPTAGSLTLGGSTVYAGQEIETALLDELAYEPEPDSSGTDSFGWTSTNGVVWADSPATVEITVEPVNDAPIALNDAYVLDEDSTLTVDAAEGVLTNDLDVEGDALRAESLAGPSSGLLTLNADGSLTYEPNADFCGEDSFTYVASDGTGQSTAATVALWVTATNDAPVAEADSFSVDEDETLCVGLSASVLSNDSDADGDALSAVIAVTASNGMLALAPDGGFTYIPDLDFHGEDSFSYTASDGEAVSDAVMVTITVPSINDAPIAADDRYEFDAGHALEVDAASGLLANDSDVDGDTCTAAIVSLPSHGELVLNADGSFTYTTSELSAEYDSFTYKASDGSADSGAATVTISIVGGVSEPSSAGGGSGESSGGCMPGASAASAELSLVFAAVLLLRSAFAKNRLRK